MWLACTKLLITNLCKIAQVIETVRESVVVASFQTVLLGEVNRAACKLAPAIFKQFPYTGVPITRNQSQIALQGLESKKQMVM
ncbi:hypothetical protein TO66_07265 [Pseudomonas sp. MRSN 12121]|nr:hypothetical protein TO66_07265 [Pseudomonas sp. MRSN 12121]